MECWVIYHVPHYFISNLFFSQLPTHPQHSPGARVRVLLCGVKVNLHCYLVTFALLDPSLCNDSQCKTQIYHRCPREARVRVRMWSWVAYNSRSRVSSGEGDIIRLGSLGGLHIRRTPSNRLTGDRVGVLVCGFTCPKLGLKAPSFLPCCVDTM